MERIETGTTTERRTRCLIFIGMCVLFAGWFGYDGWVKWPASNRAWAIDNAPASFGEVRAKSANTVRTNPKVTLATWNKLSSALEAQKSMTREDLVGMLGEPALVARNDAAGTEELMFIGPALFVHAVVRNNVVLPADVNGKANEEHSEGSIRWQRGLTYILLAVVVLGLLQFVRITRTKVVLDEQGLTYNGKRIAWDDMTGLSIGDFDRKGWVELEYRAGDETDVLRIDNYKVNAFRPIVSALCERKGFVSPYDAAARDESSGEGDAGNV